MITPKQLRARMRARPFKPFRVHLSGGSSHDVVNPEAAFVTAASFNIGVDIDAAGFASDIVRCALKHITKVEDMD